MYLEYKKYLYNWTGNDNDALKELLLSMYGLPHKPTSVTMEAGYWRKEWDVHNIITSAFKEDYDGGEVYLTVTMIETILTDLREAFADEESPISIQQLDYSIKIFEKALKDDDKYDIYYSASW